MEAILAGANSIIAIVVVLGLCLYCHELGHFVAAKSSRMTVHEFSMGFGPALFKRMYKGTLYAIRIIPFGGYVQIAGMDPGQRDVAGGFHSRPAWQRHMVLFSGVFMNVALAVVLYWGIYIFSGIPAPDSDAVIIGKVFPDQPARQAGVQPGDHIIGVGGSIRSLDIEAVDENSLGAEIGLRPKTRIFQIGDTPVAIPADVLRVLHEEGQEEREGKEGPTLWLVNNDATGLDDAMIALDFPSAEALAAIPGDFPDSRGDTIARSILGVRFGASDQWTVHRFITAHPNQRVELRVTRGGDTLKLYPTSGSQTGRVEKVDDEGKLISPHESIGRIGVTLGPELQRVGIIDGLKLAVGQSINSVAMVVLSFKAMISGAVAAEPTGPIGIMAMTAETAKLGWASVLALCALISANLAVINLLPMPPFDGGQILIQVVESTICKPLNRRLETFVRLAGLAIILNLFVFLAYKDIANLVKYGTY